MSSKQEDNANIAILVVSVLTLLICVGVAICGYCTHCIGDIALGLLGMIVAWWGAIDAILDIRDTKKRNH